MWCVCMCVCLSVCELHPVWFITELQTHKDDFQSVMVVMGGWGGGALLVHMHFTCTLTG